MNILLINGGKAYGPSQGRLNHTLLMRDDINQRQKAT